uniref:Uncharacterized protein n=1 Tax=Roseihalotalea indica TaxID=2867963 RepID=A0AA49GI33_9BACT|nr:hypothetical protein K4G66_23025 [Tunicatimonas sp. TK19036]
MPDHTQTYFLQLKKDIARTLRQSYPQLSEDITVWKGQEIRHFQQDLEEKVNGRISEKWFYTHIKSESPQLPRIDILNLLSQYAGYADWEAYQQKQSLSAKPVKFTLPIKKYSIGLGIVLVLIALVGAYIQFNQPATYQFCFVNMYTRQPVSGPGITVTVLPDGESPYRVPATEDGCLDIRWREESIRFVVQGAYYQTDTITRRLNKARPTEQVALKTNDYAWLIRIFSQSELDDWQRRREQLDAMFADDARIYQLMEDQALGMELYNKQEFINKMTMPLRSLRNIEILSTRYQGDQIQELRFKQVFDEEDH